MSLNKISLAMIGLMVSAAPVFAEDTMLDSTSWTGGWVSGGVGYGMANSDVDAGFDSDVFLENLVGESGTNEWNTEIIPFDNCEDNGLERISESACIVGATEGGLIGEALGAGGKNFRLGGGYDFQAGSNFVAGVFGDYNWSDKSAEVETEGFVEVFPFAGEDFALLTTGTALSVEVETKDSWVVGGRAGFLINPDTLFYGLVGYTEVDQKASIDYFAGAIIPELGFIDGETEASKSYTSTGIVLGAGMEARLTETISLKAEYRYTDLGSEKLSGEDEFEILDCTGSSPCTIGAEVKYDAEIDTVVHDVTVSLAYRF